jgi:amino acid adenylation domain-containing protein
MPTLTMEALKAVKSLPLLKSQKGMWIAEQIHAASNSHIVPICVVIRGPLDHRALQDAIDRLVIRHENLRVRFGVVQGTPRQLVQGEIDTALLYVDLHESKSVLQDSIRAELETPMDVEEGPLFRARLYLLGVEEHALLFAVHHLVIDHQSSDQLLRDFYALYDASVAHVPLSAALPPLALTYSDHALSGSDAQTDDLTRNYWRKDMADLPVPLLFASGNRIVPKGLRSAGYVLRQLDPSAERSLRHFAGTSGFTPFMVHLAICAVLLQRHTGAADIVLGVPFSTRSSADTQALTGLFVNTMPLRLRFSPPTSFEALLQLVRARLLRAMMYSNLPLHELISMLRLERHAGSNPLFKVCVNHATGTSPQTSAGGCNFDLLALPTLKAAFEVNLILIESTAGLSVCFEFDEDALSINDAKDILDQYEHILEAVSVTPALPVRDLKLIAIERDPAISACRQASEPVHQRIERQSSRSPDGIAIVCGARRLTYTELNARANQLASLLIDIGVGSDTLVAICIDQSPEMVIGVLAVLKAGGAYVPIDQDNPDERLRFILTDTKARILLTSTPLLYRFREIPATILCIDEESTFAGRSNQNPAVKVDMCSLIYCVYTSGSTGQPKGALNTHAGFANLVDWYVERGLNMSADARVMLASSFGFDMTQKSLLGPLCVGASLMMPACSPAEHIGFTQALTTYRPTWLSCAPSAFRTFMDIPAAAEIGTLVLGGEPLDSSLVAALQGKPVTLVNSYGPSECSDIAIWCMRDMLYDDDQDTTMPLGKPIPNVEIHILDERLQPVPAGVPGDLYIAGAGVGRGYLRRPELTAEQFLPNPYGEPGSRMYKTGDIGRRRRDGIIEYLGRADTQIKLRGNRVEPGEIESSLRGCAGVHEAVVMLKELTPGGPHLVAYIVPQEGHTIEIDVLRRELRQHLPHYMVPTAWMQLATLPLNLNGKVDRKALPLPSRGAAVEHAITPPRTLTETQLVSIWQEVLDLPEVCVFDNFFDVWGQSLLAAKMVAKVTECFGVALPTRAIFDVENLAAMAEKIDQMMAACKPSLQPIKRLVRQPIALNAGIVDAP